MNIIELEQEDPLADIVQEKLLDAATAGFEVEFSPEEAEHAGAFKEDGLAEPDARVSAVDLALAFEAAISGR